MKIKFLTVLFFLYIFPELFGQDNIRLNSSDPKNKQTVNVKLHDASNGNLLMELPLTFHIMKAEERNILFVIVGKELNKQNVQTVWMFKQALQLDELLKKNRNLKIERDFRKKSDWLEPFHEDSNNINLIDFYNEYESISAVPKPFFFEVKDISKPFELKLKFYVSVPDKDETMQILTAKAGIVRVTIDITN